MLPDDYKSLRLKLLDANEGKSMPYFIVLNKQPNGLTSRMYVNLDPRKTLFEGHSGSGEFSQESSRLVNTSKTP